MPPNQALSYVADQIRRYDRDRFVTGLFAPPERREALFALYAFNLELAKVPELVREPMMGRIRIQWWRDVVETAGEGAVPDHPVARPLIEALLRHRLDQHDLARLLDGREDDIEPRPCADMAGLERYAEATGATLARLAVDILGAEGVAREAAGHVGTAWALTGVLRAVPFHAGLGRVHLPAALLAEHGVSIDELLAGKPGPALAAVARPVAVAAAEHLRQARRHRRAVDRRALPALLPALLASRYLAALDRHGYQPFAAGWAESRPRPLLLTLGAVLGRY